VSGATLMSLGAIVPVLVLVLVSCGVRLLRRAATPGEVEQAMMTTVVRYQVKPERADENQKLIEAVFAELEATEAEGFTYKVFRLEDGVSFIHVVIEHDVEAPNSLQAVPSFQAFVADIGDRCDIAPIVVGATIVGGYR
jgi:hypothetical protein